MPRTAASHTIALLQQRSVELESWFVVLVGFSCGYLLHICFFVLCGSQTSCLFRCRYDCTTAIVLVEFERWFVVFVGLSCGSLLHIYCSFIAGHELLALEQAVVDTIALWGGYGE